MLMPAAVLVVIILGAIAVDQSVVFTQQRDLVAGAEAAANDAATYGVDKETFYSTGRIVVVQSRAQAAGAAAMRARGLDVTSLSVVPSADGRRVEVTATARVAYIFSKAVPGAPDTTTVTATAEAELRQD